MRNHKSNLSLDDHQARVVREARCWASSQARAPSHAYLAGYAGTGKTTVARAIGDGFRVRFVAPTGKAASVLVSKGCSNATTIHSLVYHPRETQTFEGALEVDFVPRTDDPLADVELLAIDEASMIGDTMWRDLRAMCARSGTKILLLGDPAQLPPVHGKSPLSALSPTWLLTTVHRQERDSGVLRLATDVRDGRLIDRRAGAYGVEVKIVTRAQFDVDQALQRRYVEADQIIVGRNQTRKTRNAMMRHTLKRGHSSRGPWPTVGDKLICRRNNPRRGLVNGEIWWCLREALVDDSKQLFVEIANKDGGRKQLIKAHTAPFVGLDVGASRSAEIFDYGYAITAHSSQGSEWPSVVVVDESWCFRDARVQWLYTAVTRASERLMLIVDR